MSKRNGFKALVFGLAAVILALVLVVTKGRMDIRKLRRENQTIIESNKKYDELLKDFVKLVKDKDLTDEDDILKEVTLTFVSFGEEVLEVSVFVVLEMSIMDVLIMNGVDESMFGDSYPGFTDRYFKKGFTGVKELEDNPDYYSEESEWDGVIWPPSLMVGLNNIIVDQDFTVVQS